jgi:DNA-binding PadR family transcriptional regulator
MKKLPELSHLQVLVLECLGTHKRSGRELRHLLAENKVKKTGPAFYQLMARLEEARFVEGEYSQKIVEGQIIKERSYRVTATGEKALRSTHEFYRNIQGAIWGGGPSHAPA